jgi:pyruvate kinase
MDQKRSLSVDVKRGETLEIDGGRILLTVEEKSGQRARLKLEFATHTEVRKRLPSEKQGQVLEPAT